MDFRSTLPLFGFLDRLTLIRQPLFIVWLMTRFGFALLLSLLSSSLDLVTPLENRCLTPEEQNVHHLVLPGSMEIAVGDGNLEKTDLVTVQAHVFLQGLLDKSSNRTILKGFLFLGERKSIRTIMRYINAL